MKRTIVTTIALLGALALPGTAIAAPAPVAAVDCSALQATYDGLMVRIDTLQERLATAPPAQKPGLIAQIKKYSAQAAAVEQQMDAAGCP
jgi:hypothetical protein